ncbi:MULTISPECIES: hypothetical protein [unclassified Streptomyces]|uniref:hypothetical protein n=1 Tax=unclassified Streptomyces TaxID=2593676 RepID=UPI000DBA3D77|nr:MULTISPECIES: hypothetical protein [unclassified Streptomyces]MYT69865.1 hypothetical protein [Streptomyces sp. SID8367]RAJ88439.1 hypothetical protein K377_01891 [Streptomyces sp. PsTaAH-137]
MGADAFEEKIGGALRRTGEGFVAEDRAALVERGMLSGRRRLRRRRAGAVGGSVAALAAVGLGASYVGGAFDSVTVEEQGVAARPGATAAQSKEQSKEGSKEKAGKAHGAGPAVSSEKILGILQKLLPEGKFSGQEGRGTGELPGPFAHLVYDDRHGKAAIGVSFGAVDPDGAGVAEQLKCPDKSFVPYDECGNEKLSDGSRLMLMRGYEYPDRRVDTKLWTAFLVTPEGYTVTASEWNAPAEKDAAVTRPRPPLSIARLRMLVLAEEWRPVLRALPAAPEEPLSQPPAQGLDQASILTKLTSLLPGRVKVTGQGGQDAEYAYVIVDDGKGATLVQINVQPHMKDAESQLFGSGTEVRPDGTKVVTRQGDGDDKGGAGIVMWTADTIRPDGLRVAVSAFNSGAQDKDATRPEPALTMAELKAIALSEKWRAGE